MHVLLILINHSDLSIHKPKQRATAQPWQGLHFILFYFLGDCTFYFIFWGDYTFFFFLLLTPHPNGGENVNVFFKLYFINFVIKRKICVLSAKHPTRCLGVEGKIDHGR